MQKFKENLKKGENLTKKYGKKAGVRLFKSAKKGMMRRFSEKFSKKELHHD